MRSSPRKQSELEKLHQQSQQLLKQKASELTAMNQVIEKAESELSTLKAELYAKTTRVELENPDESPELDSQKERYDQEIEGLMTELDTEVNEIKAVHRARMKSLAETFRKSIAEGEKWAEIHAASVKTEKRVELDLTEKQLNELLATKAESRLSSTRSRFEVYRQSKAASIMNEQRIRFLENQISETTSGTREEVRDIKAKIKEVLSSIEIRQRQHSVELENYEREVTDRQAKYDLHVAQLEQENATEKKRLEQCIASETAKVENLQRLIKQIEGNQRKCMQRSVQDVERMKATISQYKADADRSFQQTRVSASRVTGYERRKRDLDREVEMVEQEIKELSEENAQLRVQLSKLDEAVSRRSA
jgi:chromosome segregation ATPase